MLRNYSYNQLNEITDTTYMNQGRRRGGGGQGSGHFAPKQRKPLKFLDKRLLNQRRSDKQAAKHHGFERLIPGVASMTL